MTELYRILDAADRRLYIGVTDALDQRMSAHAGKHWFGDAARLVVQRYTDRRQAEDAERDAIQTESPIWNAVHSQNPPAAGTVRQVERTPERQRHRLDLIRNAIRLPDAAQPPPKPAADLAPMSPATRDYIRRLVDAAPPLSEAQRSRLATIFRPVVQQPAPVQRRGAEAA